MRPLLLHRPCGACRELVPVATGCEHWLPEGAIRKAKIRAPRTAKQPPPGDTDRMTRFMEMMNKGASS